MDGSFLSPEKDSPKPRWTLLARLGWSLVVLSVLARLFVLVQGPLDPAGGIAGALGLYAIVGGITALVVRDASQRGQSTGAFLAGLLLAGLSAAQVVNLAPLLFKPGRPPDSFLGQSERIFQDGEKRAAQQEKLVQKSYERMRDMPRELLLSVDGRTQANALADDYDEALRQRRDQFLRVHLQLHDLVKRELNGELLKSMELEGKENFRRANERFDGFMRPQFELIQAHRYLIYWFDEQAVAVEPNGTIRFKNAAQKKELGDLVAAYERAALVVRASRQPYATAPVQQ
ncbi:MAG: hypothetical protein KF871_06835 [Hydrogenophaga sp.]|uniref:hypothetical protein n=1 Tax=Hydrogenophaga sp. TaxID=1904254 RepID=UPI001D579630|nr:hypothetical protein [Hydrogenophaga sp.]MBX3609597.1 hypothetical protein [Hydrogenophaga sp.]